MRIAQEQELATVEGAQKVQFQEFNDAWDKYMADYEAAAFESVERLKEKHMQELAALSQKIYTETQTKQNWSKQLMDMRSQEKIFFSVRQYENAEMCRNRADEMENYERQYNKDQLDNELVK